MNDAYVLIIAPMTGLLIGIGNWKYASYLRLFTRKPGDIDGGRGPGRRGLTDDDESV